MNIHGKNFIEGKWYDNDSRLTSVNPSTEEVIGTFPNSNPEVIWAAVDVANKKFSEWKSTSRIHRAELFENLVKCVKLHDMRIAKAISLETGKSLNESKAEVNEAIHMAQFTAAQGRQPTGSIIASEIAAKDVMILRKPKGVVAVISPWNFPFAIGGFWTSAPALLEGNTVVFKPSEETPYVGQIIAELYEEAGFPPGVFNLVQGADEAGKALVKSKVNHICFTGSQQVGQLIRKACADYTDKSCSCEMGSKSAVVVFEDANLDLAVKACIASAFKLSGQRCVSAGRVLIQRTIFDKFVKQFVDAALALRVGDPFSSPVPDFGPLINLNQLRRVMDYNSITIPSTKVWIEGTRLKSKGFFMTPHVYSTEWNDLPTLREEVFGPHVALVPFDSAIDAVEMYNDTDFGLSLSVITNNMHLARFMRENCDFGLGYVNLPCIGAESHAPFGGVKASGYGGSSAAGTFDAVTHKITWTTNYQTDGFEMAQGLK